MDLADGHVSALEKILRENCGVFKAYNLGTGSGSSVLQVCDNFVLYILHLTLFVNYLKKCFKWLIFKVVKTFETINNISIPYKFVGRRPGDVASSYCAVNLAEKELNWKAKFGLADMCKYNKSKIDL